ncbi:hypothetical protein DFH27DRAFT_603489 [Peziza echinospora]|nr:hypothetical protein DFH27DRAFT_603489 [Peziza echinospora]
MFFNIPRTGSAASSGFKISAIIILLTTRAFVHAQLPDFLTRQIAQNQGDLELEVFYGDDNQLTDGEQFSVEEVEIPSKLTLCDSCGISTSSRFTILLLDLDSTVSGNDGTAPQFLNLLQPDFQIIDATELDSNTEPLLSYAPPAPAPGTGLHRFAWLLYNQPGGSAVPFVVQGVPSEETRDQFDIIQWEIDNGFTDGPDWAIHFVAESAAGAGARLPSPPPPPPPPPPAAPPAIIVTTTTSTTVQTTSTTVVVERVLETTTTTAMAHIVTTTQAVQWPWPPAKSAVVHPLPPTTSTTTPCTTTTPLRHLPPAAVYTTTRAMVHLPPAAVHTTTTTTMIHPPPVHSQPPAHTTTRAAVVLNPHPPAVVHTTTTTTTMMHLPPTHTPPAHTTTTMAAIVHSPPPAVHSTTTKMVMHPVPPVHSLPPVHSAPQETTTTCSTTSTPAAHVRPTTTHTPAVVVHPPPSTSTTCSTSATLVQSRVNTPIHQVPVHTSAPVHMTTSPIHNVPIPVHTSTSTSTSTTRVSTTTTVRTTLTTARALLPGASTSTTSSPSAVTSLVFDRVNNNTFQGNFSMNFPVDIPAPSLNFAPATRTLSTLLLVGISVMVVFVGF